jgi:hypothetical protein
MSQRASELGQCINNIGEKTRSLGRPRRRWVDNIKMDIREIEWSAAVRTLNPRRTWKLIQST